MIETQTSTAVFQLLAQLSDYPTPHLPAQARECARVLKAQDSRAAGHLEPFCRFVEQAGLSSLEELYTTTFDLRPVCYPYIGYQLFGDTYKRGEFLARLNERCRSSGFVVQGDLPDHLSMVLRYLAHTWDADLVAEGVIPSLERMIEALNGHPYRDLLQAIMAVLRAR